jgi:hypothetical protein
MKIPGRQIAALLTDDGKAVLEGLKVGLPDSAIVQLDVQDTDDMGVWARVGREDGDHFVLIRWEYILGLDFPEGKTMAIGIKG